MSTILDALRKAQEETGGRRESSVGDLPASGGTPSPRDDRTRRVFVWLAGILGVLAIAFVGGLALGNRVGGLLGGDDAEPPAQVVTAPPPAEERVAAAPVTAPPAVPAEPASAPQEAPPPRTAEVAPAAPPAAKAPPPAAARQAQAEPEPGPTPYGRLHVFGAAEAPSQGAKGNDDRIARLQQLREKMLKARREAAQRGADPAQEPTQIFVPPPRGGNRSSDDVAKADAGAAPAPAAPAAVAAARGGGPAAVGVSVGQAQGDTHGEIRDPDIPPLPEETLEDARVAAPAAQPADAPPPAEPAAPADAGAAAAVVANAPEQPVAEAAAEPGADEPPTQVAALPPAAPAAAPSPPVLRRAPGGAPQVSINILQWSTEPGRRFAFVSVDGGGMTQVREGDRIGGLTVKHIHQQMIEFGFNDSTFLLRAN